MDRQHSSPVLLAGDGHSVALERVPQHGTDATLLESEIQAVVHAHDVSAFSMPGINLLGGLADWFVRLPFSVEGGKIEGQPREFPDHLRVLRTQHLNKLFLSRLTERKSIKRPLPRQPSKAKHITTAW